MTALEATAAQATRCARHPEQPAAGTCTRCGAFVCSRCVGEINTCPPCMAIVLAELPLAAPRAKVARFFLLGAAVEAVLAGLLSVATATANGPTLKMVMALLAGLNGLLALAVAVGAGISFLMWQHLVVRRATALGKSPGETAGWSVGWWFVPLANLVKPYQVIDALAWSLAGRERGEQARVGLWWFVYLASGVAAYAPVFIMFAGERGGALVVLTLLAKALSLWAALLAATMVLTIQEGLEETERAASAG